jgi:hypothetical protein
MTRQMFDAMIGTSPVSTVDIDAVIARERAARRRRRTGAVVVCTAAVFALLVGSQLLLRPQRQVPGITIRPSPSAAPSPGAASPPTALPSATGGTTPAGPTTPAGDPAVRIGDAMREAVRKAVPGAEMIGVGSSRPFDIDRLAGGTASPGSGGGGYSGQAVVRASGRAGRVVVTVYQGGGPDIPAPGECTPIPGHPCATKAGAGPRGERYAAYQRVVGKGIVSDKPDFEVRENWVDLRRADGTVVYAMANNMVFTSDLRLAAGSTQPALTVDQLIAVALDPGLDL